MKLQNISRKYWKAWLIVVGIAGLMIAMVLSGFPSGQASAQQPTGSVPTVTGTPAGPYVTVYTNQLFIDVYAGPSSYNYNRVGVLASGEKAQAVGLSQDGNWIQIIYLGVPGNKGWVYAPFVSITPGILPKLAAPPTAVPLTTPTLNPTSVAAFGVQLEPTHVPTFTPPAALKVPMFAPNTNGGTKVPYGLIILVLAFIGVLGAVISFLRGNR